MLETIVEGVLVVWLVTVTVVVLKFLWWVVSPLPDSELSIEDIAEGSPLEDIEEAYSRIHEQAHKEKS